MKNKFILIMLTILMALCSACGKDTANPYEGYKDRPITDPYKIFYLTYADTPEMYNFVKKRQKLFSVLKKYDGSPEVNVKEEFKWLSANYFTISRATDRGYTYIGEMDGKRPDGAGKLLKFSDIKYAGEFNDGVIDGYGLEYNKGRLVYEGQWKDGKYNGKGNLIYYKNSNLDDKPYMIVSAAFADGEIKSGEGVIYGFSQDGNLYLYYKGDLNEDGVGDGDGTIYYLGKDIPKYTGEFKNGKYHGKGTLYDENGKEIYKGKWEDGDYAG